MTSNLSSDIRVLDPMAPRSSLDTLFAWLERRIAARWDVWAGWVRIEQLRTRDYDSDKTNRMRERHRQQILAFTSAGIATRLVRRHRLDDPRITDELRAVLVRAVMERRKKARAARGCTLANGQGPTQGPTPNDSPAVREFSRTDSDNAITIDMIRERVSEYFHLRELGDQDLKARTRRQVIAFPRQLAMYLARRLTTVSLPEIGREFGMHHTTVLHSIRKIETMRRSDKDVDRVITRLLGTFSQL